MGNFDGWVGYRNSNIMAVPDTEPTKCKIKPIIGTAQRSNVPNKLFQPLESVNLKEKK